MTPPRTGLPNGRNTKRLPSKGNDFRYSSEGPLIFACLILAILVRVENCTRATCGMRHCGAGEKPQHPCATDLWPVFSIPLGRRKSLTGDSRRLFFRRYSLSVRNMTFSPAPLSSIAEHVWAHLRPSSAHSRTSVLPAHTLQRLIPFLY